MTCSNTEDESSKANSEDNDSEVYTARFIPSEEARSPDELEKLQGGVFERYQIGDAEPLSISNQLTHWGHPASESLMAIGYSSGWVFPLGLGESK